MSLNPTGEPNNMYGGTYTTPAYPWPYYIPPYLPPWHPYPWPPAFPWYQPFVAPVAPYTPIWCDSTQVACKY